MKQSNKIALDFSFEHVDLKETVLIVNIEFGNLEPFINLSFK